MRHTLGRNAGYLALRSHCPTGAAAGEAQGVVAFGGEVLPGFAEGSGDVAAAGARRDCAGRSWNEGQRGTVSGRPRSGWRGPGFSAIVRDGDVVAIFSGLGVVASHRDPVAGAAEGEREDAARRRIVTDGRLGRRPPAAPGGGAA